MTSFKYAAKNNGGQTVEGTIQAEGKGEALAELRRQNLVPIRVDEVSGRKAKGPKKVGGGISLFKAGPRANKTELVLFTRQLSTMVSAGLALLEAIEVLGDQAETPGLKATCERLGSELRAGSDLSSAMETCPKAFSPLYVSMVRAGEASGQMDVILERLADYLESSQALQREVKSAMTYPIISLVLVLGITAFLMLGVVPTFEQVFDGLGTELPPLTAFVLGVSKWMKTKWIVWVGGLFGSIFGLIAFKKTSFGQLTFDQLSLKAPIFGPICPLRGADHGHAGHRRRDGRQRGRLEGGRGLQGRCPQRPAPERAARAVEGLSAHGGADDRDRRAHGRPGGAPGEDRRVLRLPGQGGHQEPHEPHRAAPDQLHGRDRRRGRALGLPPDPRRGREAFLMGILPGTLKHSDGARR